MSHLIVTKHCIQINICIYISGFIYSFILCVSQLLLLFPVPAFVTQREQRVSGPIAKQKINFFFSFSFVHYQLLLVCLTSPLTTPMRQHLNPLTCHLHSSSASASPSPSSDTTSKQSKHCQMRSFFFFLFSFSLLLKCLQINAAELLG